VAVAGVVIGGLGYLERAELMRSETLGARGGFRRNVIAPANRRFVGTRTGGRVQDALLRAGIERVLPLEGLAGGIAAVVAVTWAASRLLAAPWALLCGAAAVFAVRGWVRHRQRQQLIRFLGQMPELARVLSNATSAGLSIRTAIEMAAEELQPPVRDELRLVVRELQVGTPLEEALTHLEQRLSGRELRVLVGTLIISQRAGGSLITALRHISDTLEDRKELNREVRTVLAQATYTGYLVVVMGIGLLLLINGISPGLLRKMTAEVIGQIALVVAVGLFGLGVVIIRRMTRIEV
jgi:tight adherence protein B